MKDIDSLIVEQLNFSYSDGSLGNTDVFFDLSFKIKCGEIVGLLGPNGCGKSTLLTAIVSGLRVDDEKVRLFNHNGEKSTSVSIIPQDYRNSFFPWASLSANLKIFLSGSSKTVPKEINYDGEAIMEKMGINIPLKLRPTECSGGMLQQVALIRALAKNPKLLLADEPFSALDFNVSGQIRTAFRAFIKERQIPTLIVLHDIQEIVETCDTVFVIPGRPYSSTGREETVKIEVIQNAQPDNIADPKVTFIEAARRLLAPNEE